MAKAKKTARGSKGETVPEMIAGAIGTAAGTVVKTIRGIVTPADSKPAPKKAAKKRAPAKEQAVKKKAPAKKQVPAKKKAPVKKKAPAKKAAAKKKSKK